MIQRPTINLGDLKKRSQAQVMAKNASAQLDYTTDSDLVVSTSRGSQGWIGSADLT